MFSLPVSKLTKIKLTVSSGRFCCGWNKKIPFMIILSSHKIAFGNLLLLLWMRGATVSCCLSISTLSLDFPKESELCETSVHPQASLFFKWGTPHPFGYLLARHVCVTHDGRSISAVLKHMSVFVCSQWHVRGACRS